MKPTNPVTNDYIDAIATEIVRLCATGNKRPQQAHLVIAVATTIRSLLRQQKIAGESVITWTPDEILSLMTDDEYNFNRSSAVVIPELISVIVYLSGKIRDLSMELNDLSRGLDDVRADTNFRIG